MDPIPIEPPSKEPPLGLPRVARELVGELRARPKLPPGDTGFNLGRSLRMQRDPLTAGLESYERFGPVYTHRVFHRKIVFMLGPEANHFVTVSGAKHMSWRRGMFGEQLIPLLGDGLLTTDGAYHDHARQIMMPAFHRRRMDAAVEVMVDETTRSLDALRAGEVVDVYHWIRGLTTEIAMRALLGVDPHDGGVGREAAELFERALAFFGTPLPLMALRGPRSPWKRLQEARARLDRIIYAEIERRRARDARGNDVLSMLLEARAQDGTRLTDRELRDQAMTLLAAGHDTTSSTVAFMLYELARNPDVTDRIVAEADSVLGGAAPHLDQLSEALPELGMAVDETLRLYPPAWFGPRRASRTSSSEASRSPRELTSATARGPATASPTSSRTPRSSSPSGLPPRHVPRFRGGPTSRSAAGPGSASASVSACSSSRRPRRSCFSGCARSFGPAIDSRSRQSRT